MKRMIITLLFLVGIISIPCNAQNKTPVFIFDIHGVLLTEHIAEYLAQQSSLTKSSVHKMKIYQLLCQLLKIHKPLSDIDYEYPKNSKLPYEIYGLFTGKITPNLLLIRLKKMITEAAITNNERTLLSLLLQVLFDRSVFANVVQPLKEGIQLFHTLIKQYPDRVCIVSNAPHDWVTSYCDIFPTLFNALPPHHLMSSGLIQSLKPDKRIFEYVANHFKCKISDLVLIDDTPANVTGARELGIRAFLFSSTEPFKTWEALWSERLLADLSSFSGNKKHTLPTQETYSELKELLA